MKCGTRSLAVLGALALSAMGLVPAAWANEASQSGSAQSGETGPGLVDTPIPDIQAVGVGDGGGHGDDGRRRDGRVPGL